MGSRGVVDTGEPSRLDGADGDTWRVLAGVLVHLPAALDAQLQRDAGMSWFEYQVLAALAEAPERSLRLTELAEVADASLSRLSRAIDRLDKRGWMERRTDPTDGRYTLGVLTDAGWQQVLSASSGHVAELRRLVFDALSAAEIHSLGELGTRVRQALERADSVPRPRG